MSHTTRTESGTVFIHNGDYSGTVRIVVQYGPGKTEPHEVDVPFTDLRELVYGYLRGRISERIEQADDEEFEGFLLGSRMTREASR